MASKEESRRVSIYINGDAAEASLKQLTGASAKLSAEIGHLKPGTQEFIDKAKDLASVRSVLSDVRTDITKVGDALKDSKGFFADFNKGFSQIEELAGRVTAGALIYKGVSAGIEFIKNVWNGSEQAFMEAEKTQAQLAAVLKSTAGAAGIQKDALLKLQEVQMNKTGIDDDVIAKGEEMLLTFTNVKGVIYEKAIPSILDMTAAMNGGSVGMESIQKTSLQVGKALNDPINGLTALKKVGVSFTDSQKEQIKTLQDSGDMMGAQTIILKELEKEFGGTAKAIRDTRTGELQAFDTDLGNLQERIGSWIVDGKAGFAAIFGPLVKWLGDTRSEAQRLSEEFKNQKEQVDGLQKNMLPLVGRYDELKTKGKLNNDEQKELKTIIGQIADAIPSAVTQWDKLGNAMGINTDKAREFVKIQQALLKNQNKDAIESANKEIAQLTEKQKEVQYVLNAGVTFNGNNWAATNGRQLNDREKRNMAQQLKDIATDIADKQTLLKGLSGSYMDDLNKTTATTTKAIKSTSEMTVGELQKRIQSLNESLNDTVIGSAAYKKIIKDINDTEKLLNQTKSDKNQKGVDDKSAKKRAEEKKQQDEYLAQSAALDEKLKEFNAGQLADTLSKNDKEAQALENKYDKEISATQTALDKLKKDKYRNATDIASQQAQIDQLSKDKTTAVGELREKQDKELTDNIIAYRNQLAGKLASELEKEKMLINQHYDDLASKSSQDDDTQFFIEFERQKELTAAKLRDETTFLEQKATLEDEFFADSKTKGDRERAAINKKYDGVISDLKKKFADNPEVMAFIDKLNGKRNEDIANVGKDKNPDSVGGFLDAMDPAEKKKRLKAAAIDAAQQTTNAIFEIGKANRQRETDLHISQLEKQKAAELSNKNLTEAQKTAINDKYAKQEAALKLKQWKSDQSAAETSAVINGALNVLKAFPDPFAMGAALLLTGIQVATIASQKPPQFFADGGYSAVDYGNPSGWVKRPTLFANSSSGRPFVAGEGHKSEYIISSTQLRDPVVANFVGMMEANRNVRKFEMGGWSGSPGTSTGNQGSPVSNDYHAVVYSRLDRIEAALEKQAMINERDVVFNTTTFDRHVAKNVQIKTQATS